MARINRVRTALTGFPGAPGVFTHYCLDPLGFITPWLAFLNGLKDRMPLDVTMAIETTGDQIEATDGSLVGSWNVSPTFGVIQIGSVAGGYSAPSGAVAEWHTDTIIDSHHLKGKTFLVPLAGSHYQADGSVDADITGTLLGLASAFVAAASDNFVVWHRPRKASTLHPVARAGSFAFVTSVTIPDKAAVLRSRRD